MRNLPNFSSSNFPKVRLGALLLGQTWEVAASLIAKLGSCHLRKYPWDVATWDNAYEIVPNIK